MQYFWSLSLLAVLVAGLAGCQSGGTRKGDEYSAYEVSSAPYGKTEKVKVARYSGDEYQQKKYAQTLTLGGRREDGLHRIDYSDPNYMDVVIFTKRAQDYFRRNGRVKALDDFMSPGSQFVSGRMYVFAYSRGGECLADWAEPGKIGRVDDYDFINAAIQAAELGGGWVEGSGIDPVDGKVYAKESYILSASDDIIIGAGLYKNRL